MEETLYFFKRGDRFYNVNNVSADHKYPNIGKVYWWQQLQKDNSFTGGHWRFAPRQNPHDLTLSMLVQLTEFMDKLEDQSFSKNPFE